MTPTVPAGVASTSSPRVWIHTTARSVAGVRQVLKLLGAAVESCASLAAAEGIAAGEVVVANYDQLTPEDQQALERLSAQGVSLVLLSNGPGRVDLVKLFGSGVLKNLIALEDGVVDQRALSVTLSKLLGANIFGIEQYLIGPTTQETVPLTRATDRTRVIQRAEELAASMGSPPRLVAHFRTVADEMLTNALFNAPVDASGKRRFAHLDRREEVGLEAHEAVEAKLCCTPRRLGISVSDPFGSLAADRVLSSLSRCFGRTESQIEYKAGGAGLGLYQTLESLSEFVVNIRPGVRTELLGFIEVRSRYRDFSSKGKSFNLFLDTRP